MINVLLAQNGITNPAISTQLGSGEGGLALGIIMARLFRTAVVVGGLALLLYLAWGGLNWITAGGDTKKVDAAKAQITNGIMGMAILVATIAVAAFLSGVFGLDLLRPVLTFDN